MAGKEPEHPSPDSGSTDELSMLKCTFPGRVRVITDVGEFTHVITVQPVENIDMHVKLQLTDKYPGSPPTVIIRSVTLTPEQASTLKGHLQNEAEGLVRQEMMSPLMISCLKWLHSNNIQTSDNKTASAKPKCKSKQQNKHTGRKSKFSTENEEKNSKKPSMKTAADVIKRIQWDTGVNKDDFIVGYMDRLVGLVERSFTAFTWEDLASVDHYSLAIPQHRIQYFKYKTEKVWDKNERLDNVFGSTGSKLTIIEAIEQYHAKHPEEQNASSNIQAVDNAVDENNGTLPDTDADFDGGDNEWNNEGEDHDDYGDNDDDDDVKVTMETGAYGGVENIDAMSLNYKAEAESKAIVSSDRKPASKGFRPNFFVAFRIADENVVKRLVEVQDKIQAIYPQYGDERYRIQSNGFHVTLAVMQMTSPGEERHCVDAMEHIKHDLKSVAWDAGQLVFRGIDFFSPKVLYVKTEQSPALLEIAETIRRSLRKFGIQVEDKQFKAHVTLFKVPKSVHFSPNTLQLGELSVMEFGSQFIDNIQVCRMGTIQVHEKEFCYTNIWRETLANTNFE